MLEGGLLCLPYGSGSKRSPESAATCFIFDPTSVNNVLLPWSLNSLSLSGEFCNVTKGIASLGPASPCFPGPVSRESSFVSTWPGCSDRFLAAKPF